MADDVAVMYCGQVVEKAPVRSIFGDNSYLHPYTEGLLYSIPRLDTPTGIRLEAIPGAVPHPLDLRRDVNLHRAANMQQTSVVKWNRN